MKIPNQNNPDSLEKAITKHFSSISMSGCDSELFNKIINKIELEKQLEKLIPKLWAAFVLFLIGVATLILAVNFASSAFAQSPAAKYLSLIFTDFRAVLDNWQDYTFSILESLPLSQVAVLLSGLLAGTFIFDFGFSQFSNFKAILNMKNYGTHQQ